jgi:hypothetical protein
LHLAGQIGPEAHNCKTERVLEVMFVVGCH